MDILFGGTSTLSYYHSTMDSFITRSSQRQIRTPARFRTSPQGTRSSQTDSSTSLNTTARHVNVFDLAQSSQSTTLSVQDEDGFMSVDELSGPTTTACNGAGNWNNSEPAHRHHHEPTKRHAQLRVRRLNAYSAALTSSSHRIATRFITIALSPKYYFTSG